MEIKDFLGKIGELGVDCFTGVPDSQLKALCDTLYFEYGISDRHLVAANEGAAVAYAAGHYLATGKPALVYMQNSGIGNAVNPICSLINDKVYAIPVVFVVGWRGEPGVHDEPQHIFQGEITQKLLEVLEIKSFVIDKQTGAEEFAAMIESCKEVIAGGRSVAFVVKKEGLKSAAKPEYKNDNTLSREKIVEAVTAAAGERDIFVSTTGKLSRELFEIRERRAQGHQYDFLTVGSMGHSIMIAYGIAREKKNRRVYCLDGDGAVLMHTGSLAVAGSNAPHNLVHVVVNNGSHETVGGIPTVASKIDLPAMALACGYSRAYTAATEAELDAVLKQVRDVNESIFIEVKANLESRANLGRPTTTPVENKIAFMKFVAE